MVYTPYSTHFILYSLTADWTRCSRAFTMAPCTRSRKLKCVWLAESGLMEWLLGMANLWLVFVFGSCSYAAAAEVTSILATMYSPVSLSLSLFNLYCCLQATACTLLMLISTILVCYMIVGLI